MKEKKIKVIDYILGILIFIIVSMCTIGFVYELYKYLSTEPEPIEYPEVDERTEVIEDDTSSLWKEDERQDYIDSIELENLKINYGVTSMEEWMEIHDSIVTQGHEKYYGKI